jgi:hypothetical protein
LTAPGASALAFASNCGTSHGLVSSGVCEDECAEVLKVVDTQCGAFP